MLITLWYCIVFWICLSPDSMLTLNFSTSLRISGSSARLSNPSTRQRATFRRRSCWPASARASATPSFHWEQHVVGVGVHLARTAAHPPRHRLSSLTQPLVWRLCRAARPAQSGLEPPDRASEPQHPGLEPPPGSRPSPNPLPPRHDYISWSTVVLRGWGRPPPRPSRTVRVPASAEGPPQCPSQTWRIRLVGITQSMVLHQAERSLPPRSRARYRSSGRQQADPAPLTSGLSLKGRRAGLVPLTSGRSACLWSRCSALWPRCRPPWRLWPAGRRKWPRRSGLAPQRLDLDLARPLQ